MDVLEADLLKEIDPAELGQRIRAARVAKGWNQTQLAGQEISVGYVSRIESGQRRPNAATLETLAARLGVPTEHLLRGVTAREYDEIKLTLDFAELSLETGQHLEAETQARQAVDRATLASQDEMAFRGHYLIARALEGQGNIDDAIIELEALVYSKRGGLVRIKAAIAMVRCLKSSGDFTRAIEVGERVMASLAGSHIDSCDEAVQLAVTVASAYFLRGDSGHAIRMCRKAIVNAEALESSVARASAYWNASAFEAQRGSVANAVPLAERALALLAEGQDTRNVARLRNTLGRMQLELDPPDVNEAMRHLEQAAEELVWSSASPGEIASNRLGIARAYYLDGDLLQAREACSEVIAALNGEDPILTADAEALSGQVAAAGGDLDGARRAYRRAVFVLTGIGADRDAAQLWFELADLFEDVGDIEASRDAYRSAAASSGLKSRPKVRAGVPQL
ncbi:MAG TPA: helix-turn-helix transcriptional regulator [Nocardioides sp.]|jgi:transcriptional regulator with XRE-family HTH domain/Tfp pilus assembly protein PilF|nr:helix-turn-helix transcriptional regulator [Nocardioides sp.]